MQEVDSITPSGIEDVVGINISRLGVIADGSCLLHCLLYARHHAYRRSTHDDRKAMASRVRLKLSKKNTLLLSECGFNMGKNKEDASRRSIASTTVYMDERHIQLLMSVYNINIVITQDATGDVACAQSRVTGPDIDMRIDPLKNDDCDTIFIYRLENHFELLFFTSDGYNKYVFGAEDPIMRTTRERYMRCCDTSKKRRHGCFPKYRDKEMKQNTAKNVRREKIDPRALEWMQLRQLASDIGVHTNILALSEEMREYIEDAIDAQVVTLLRNSTNNREVIVIE